MVKSLFLESIILHWLLSARVGRGRAEAIGSYEAYTEPEIMGGRGQHVRTVKPIGWVEGSRCDQKVKFLKLD